MPKRFLARTLGVFALLVLASCLGEGTGPGEMRMARLDIRPQFDAHGLRAVDVNRVRILITRPANDGETVLDTTVAFPAAEDTLQLNLLVPVQGFSESLELTMFLLDDPGGIVVFQAGPTTFTATVGSQTEPAAPLFLYTGPGSNAVGVRFVATPPTVFFGDTVLFTAEAVDGANNPIPNTPIVWSSSDPTRALVPDESFGRVVGGTQRGNATVTASLLRVSPSVTPPSVNGTLPVQPKPNQIAIQGGGSQSGTVGQALAQPVTVRVRAADNLAVSGVVVNFAATGAILSQLADTTDANGDASVLWTLSGTPGAQQLTATVVGVAGISTNVPASAAVGAPNRLAFTVQPSNVQSGSAIAPAVQVAARDSFNNPTPAFTGTVTLAIGTNPAGGTIGGTTAVAAVAGVANFSNVTLTNAGVGYTLTANATGLTAATSTGLTVTAPATRISWTNPAGGNWSVGANWSRGTAPVAGDTVNISLAGTYTVNVDINATVLRVEVGGASGTQTLQINTNSLVVSGSGAIGTSGRLALGGGSLAGTGVIDILGNMTWAGGDLGGAGGVTNILPGGTLTILGSVGRLFTNHTLNLGGTGTWTGNAQFSTGLGTVLRVLAGAALDVQGDPQLNYNQGGAAPLFDNNGTVSRTVSTSNLLLNLPLGGNGAWSLQSGQLDIQGGGVINGAVTVAPGTNLQVNNGTLGFGAGSSITGAGVVEFNGGTGNVAGNYSVTGTTRVQGGTANFNGAAQTTTNLDISGGTLGGTGLLTVSGALAWSGGNIAGGDGTLRVAAAGGTLAMTGTANRNFTAHTLENSGTATWSGTFTLNTGLSAVLRNTAGATFTLSGDGAFPQSLGFPQTLFDNQGTFTRNTSTGTATWGAFFQDTTGSTTIATGTFALSGGGRLGGTKTITAGAILDLTSGTMLVRPATAFAGTGLLRASGGSLLGPDSASAVAPVTNAVSVNNFDLAGGSLAHEGLFIVNTTMNWTAGTLGSNVVGLGGITRIGGTLNMTMGAGVTMSGAITLDNQGTVNYSGAGNINSGLGAIITNAGSFVWSGNGSILSNQGAPITQFNNIGNLQRTTSAGAAVIDGVMNKQGGFNILTGSISLNRGSVTNFVGAVNGPGTLNLSGGVFSMTGNMTAAGNVIVNSGTLIMNGFSFQVTGNFSTVGGGLLTMINAADSLDINGNASFGGGLSTTNAGVIRLAGNFSQTGTTSFQGQAQSAAVAHRVVLDGATGTQNVNFADPVGSFFRRLVLQRGAGTSTVLQTDVRTTFFSMQGGTYSLTGVAGPPMSRLIADTVAGANSGSVSMVSPLVLVVNGALVDSNVINVDTVVFAGANQSILRTFPGGGAATYTYRSIRIAQTAGTASIAWPVLPTLTMTNDLVVSAGALNLNGRRINVTGAFRTETGGVLRMQTAADSLLVAGAATFAGGSTTGQLTAGATGFATNFDQGGGAADAFAPSGAHHTVLGNVGTPQSISFANPTTSFFDALEVPATTHTVTMLTNMLVNDSLIIQGGGGAADLVTVGTTQRLRVNGVVSIPLVTFSGRLAPAVLEMGNAVPVVGNIASPRGMSADTTVFLGTLATLPVGPGIHYNHLRVGTGAAFTMNVDTITGDFVVSSGAAQFGFTGIFQTNRFRTQATGSFTQTAAGTQVIVVDSAVFGGAASSPTAGTFQAQRNFVQQGGATNAYAPTGTHTTSFGSPAAGTDSNTVFFANPITSFFNTVTMSKGVTPTRGVVTLQSDARSVGAWTVANSTDLRGAGQRAIVGGVLTAIISTTSPTINTLLALELGATPNVTIAGATADTIVFNNAIANVPGTGFTYNNVRVNTSGTINVPSLTLAGDLVVSAGSASYSVTGTLTINGKLRTQATGTFAMPVGAGAPTVQVADSAIFGGGTSNGLTTGTLRLLGHFTANGSSFQPSTGHTTVFGGNIGGGAGQRVTFGSPGIAGGNSWFGNMLIARPGTLPAGVALGSSVFVIGTLQDTSTSPVDSILGPGVVTAVNMSTGSAFVMNNATLVLNGYTAFNTSGLTFRNMNPGLTYLTLIRTTAGGSTVSGINFATAVTPGVGRYFNLNATGTYSLTVTGAAPAAAAMANNYIRTGTPLPTVTWNGTNLVTP